MQVIALLLMVVQVMTVQVNQQQLMLMEVMFFLVIYQVRTMKQQTKLALI